MKGDYLQCKNYRPISLILNKSKKTEKLVHQRLYLFLEQNSISYNNMAFEINIQQPCFAQYNRKDQKGFR